MFQPFPCTRNLKISKVLIDKGIDVFLFYNSPNVPKFTKDYYTKLVRFKNERDMIEKVKEHEIDITHSHNFPDMFPIILKKRLPNIPVIYNIHDLTSAYYAKDVMDNDNILEQLAVESADGIIHVSPFLNDCVKRKYPDEHKRVKNYVLPNLVLERDVPAPEELRQRYSKSDGITRIVYQGGVATASDHRNYLPIWKNISDRGAEVHFYPFFNDYAAQKVAMANKWLFYHAPVSTPDLLRTINRYDIGYVGYSNRFLLLDGALPNKMYEYAACGLPVAAQPFTAIADFVTKEKIGFVWNNIDELYEKMPEWKDYREQKIYSYDQRADELIKFHESLL